MDSVERRRQNRAAFISAREIAHILDRALPGSVLRSFELLSGGANLNYMLRLEETDASFVLRVYTRDPSVCQKEDRARR